MLSAYLETGIAINPNAADNNLEFLTNFFSFILLFFKKSMEKFELTAHKRESAVETIAHNIANPIKENVISPNVFFKKYTAMLASIGMLSRL